MSEHTSVAVRDLEKSYGNTTVLDGLCLNIRRGSRTVVLGPNGAGKSTLLEIVATLRSPGSGTVVVEGHDVVAHTRQARQLIGLAPQSNALDPLASPQEVLDFRGAVLGLHAAARASCWTCSGWASTGARASPSSPAGPAARSTSPSPWSTRPRW